MSLCDLHYRSLYILPRDSFVEEVLIRSLKHATSFDCMFGFFGSAVLKVIAPGLAAYLGTSTEPMRLTVSPNISETDAEALRQGISQPKEVLEARLRELLGDAKLSDSALVEHTLQCMAYMLSAEQMKFRIAWLRNGALFHPKVWLFHDAEHTVAAHGSSNMTMAGLAHNHEQIRVDASWDGDKARETIDAFTKEFQDLWVGTGNHVVAFDLPEALKRDLIREYAPGSPPTLDDFRRAWEEDATKVLPSQPPPPTRVELAIPDHLNLYSGPFAHQGKALDAWEEAGRRGILAMATGSGKTITALAGATRLQHEVDKLLIVISAPYRPLVMQWVDECTKFGVEPLPTAGSVVQRAQELDQAIRRLRFDVSKVEIQVVTEDFLVSASFRQVLARLPASVAALFIADEMHHLGSASFVTNTPERFDYRLGLSATPIRQYDPEGTSALIDYFGGEPVFEFALQDAIGICLVPYNYYLHSVDLTQEEYEGWMHLTARLRRLGFQDGADVSATGKLEDDVQRLLLQRRRILETAENKVEVLRQILKKRRRDTIRHVLVYASDKNRNQLNAVNAMLQDDLNLMIHEFTSRQTSSRAKAADLLVRFARGDYHVLTSMRVLDEGMDIPQVCEAFILASTTVERQWIQRRGRVLRQCKEIGKEQAKLHDFIVVPPQPSRSILVGELNRAREFAKLALNGAGQPYRLIKSLTDAMFD